MDPELRVTTATPIGSTLTPAISKSWEDTARCLVPPHLACLHLRMPISSFRLYISSRFIWGMPVEGRSWICFKYLKPPK
jgi:hypothetical protein